MNGLGKKISEYNMEGVHNASSGKINLDIIRDGKLFFEGVRNGWQSKEKNI